MKIIEIDNSNNTALTFIKGLTTKRSGDLKSYPKIVVRSSSFDFDQKKVDYFAKLAGFKSDSKILPSIYIHLIGFKLQMELIFHEDFPFPAMGMVNISNKAIQLRPFTLNEIKKVECYLEEPKEHSRGFVYTVVSKVYDENNIIISENYAKQLKILKKSENNSSAKKEFKAIEGNEREFSYYANSGRSFSKVSGDINPIHLFALTAKLFGFKKQIAHGMFSSSRILAQLEKETPLLNSFEFYTEYKQPIFLPSKSKFITQKKADNEIAFELVNSEKKKPHVVGYFNFK
ncbi:MAG: MaoC/PaaZ C-terminal domain-containing protein [Solirubrobacteraceae bacterium]